MDLYDEWDAIARAMPSLPPEDVARLMTQAATADAATREQAESTLIRHYARWVLRCVRVHAARSAALLQRPGPERSELVAAAFVAFLRALRGLAQPPVITTALGAVPAAIRQRPPHESLPAYSEIRIQNAVHATLVALRLGVSVDVAAVRHRVRSAAAVLTQQLGAPPTPEQVSQLLTARALEEIRARRGEQAEPLRRELWRAGALSPTTVARYLSDLPEEVPLEALGPAGETVDPVVRGANMEVIDRITDAHEGALQQLLRAEQDAEIVQRLANADPRVATPHLRHLMFEMRFGLGGKYPYSVEEIASLTGLGERRVRQINAESVRAVLSDVGAHASPGTAAVATQEPRARPRSPRPPGGAP